MRIHTAVSTGVIPRNLCSCPGSGGVVNLSRAAGHSVSEGCEVLAVLGNPSPIAVAFRSPFPDGPHFR